MAKVCEVLVGAKGYVPQLMGQDREGGFIKDRKRYERRVEQVFGTVEFEAGSVLKNLFVFVSAGGEDGKQICAGNVLYCLK